ncbi:response regulator [Paenibacillus abyssi]|uniref:DNA-binding response regulator n=1 Tax=Paenibacillus abyssi TaxID=1340531 RepID=A0A917CYG7_9BACL|nr:response regulator [Paenibacillus abyssi]GGG02387.1 hypothetical protein GCM10010916_19460 [Paenibacillus abyssi]
MKILIVDDEQRIIEGLREFLPWEQLGIEELLTADSGESGYQVFVDHVPDIIITDIMMSGISGLDMIRQIRKRDESLPILVLSAYDLFSYAKEAVDLGVTRYILKPIVYADIEAMVGEVVKELKAKKMLQEFELRSRQQIRTNMEALKEKFLYDVLTLPMRFDDYFVKDLDYYGVPPGFLEGGIVMTLQAFRSNNGKITCEKHWKIYRFAVKNIVHEVLSGWQPSYHLPFHDDRMTVIFVGPDAGQLLEAARSATSEIIHQIYAYLEIEVNAAIGRWYPHPSEYSRSFKESIEVLKFSEFEGYKRIDFIEDIQETAYSGVTEYPLKDMQVLIEAVSRKEWKEAKGVWEDIASFITAREEAVSFDFVRMLCASLISALIVSGGRREKDFSALLEAQNYQTKRELIAYVRRLMEQRAESGPAKKNQSSYVSYIQKYVDEHYHEEISFSQLAKDMHLSRPYLSYLFNRDTGETFANYLIQYRVNIAKKIMQSSQYLMVREVASMVGYSDPAYFSRIFKNITGMSPSEYQMRLN